MPGASLQLPAAALCTDGGLMTGIGIFFGVGAFLMGLVIGSFLNVCIYRMPREESLVYPPSHCPRCYQPIKAEDNIPIISWMLLRGRCRSCGERISPVYPAVELFTGILFAFYYWRFIRHYVPTLHELPETGFVVRMGALYIVHMGFISALLVATFIDFKYMIIPDEISIGGTFVAVLASFVFPEIHQSALVAGRPHLSGLISSLAGAGAGAAVVYGIGLLGKAALRKEAMGFGDVKLMAMIGAFLGWQLVIFVLFFSALLGTLYGIVHLAVTGHSRIPYGPFLSLAAVISLIFRAEVTLFLNNMIANYRFLLG